MSFAERPYASIEFAAELLARGGLVAFPTETVYGVGATVRRPSSVARIFEIKGRPSGRPLTVHVAGVDAIDTWAENVPSWARALAEALWPGPLSLVFDRRPGLADVVTGGGATVGLRAPDHAVALSMLKRLSELEGAPAGVAAPSANRFGQIPPTSAQEVRSVLPGVDAVLDGGRCALGIESTVLDATGEIPRILRAGAISRNRLEELTGLAVEPAMPPARRTAAQTSGSEVGPDVASVAGPKARVDLGDVRCVGVEHDAIASLRPRSPSAVIARIPRPDHLPAEVLWVQLPDDQYAFARELYPQWRRLGAAGYSMIYVQRAPPGAELAAAIDERIARRGGST